LQHSKEISVDEITIVVLFVHEVFQFKIDFVADKCGITKLDTDKETKNLKRS
jgi:hypothetical protein